MVYAKFGHLSMVQWHNPYELTGVTQGLERLGRLRRSLNGLGLRRLSGVLRRGGARKLIRMHNEF